MARVTDNGLVGLVGPLVFYEMNGKQYARKKPSRMNKKRNGEVQKANNLFGTVSTYGTKMINELKPYLSFPFSREGYNNLRGWIYNEYKRGNEQQSWSLDSGNTFICPMNGVDVRDCMKIDVQVKNEGTGINIHFPAFNPVEKFKPQLHTLSITIKMVAVTSSFAARGVRTLPTFIAYEFDYSSQQLPEKEFLLQTNGDAGDIAIVVFAIEYTTRASARDESGPVSGAAAAVAIGKLQ